MIRREEEAREIAVRYLAEIVEPSADEDVIVTWIREYPTCWVVGYNTRTYVETRTVSHSLAGGPIIINRETGALRVGLSSKPVEQQLDP